MPTIGVAPGPNHYAVIRIDPIAMITDLGLDDPVTLAEAKQMVTKRYLVYLNWPLELFMPDMRWCRYDVDVIGTTLRPPDENVGITSDMVIPIAPNKDYTGERRPVNPHPSFPYSNCYHWIRNRMEVRVRTREGGFDHDRAFMLPSVEHIALKDGLVHDFRRLAAFRIAKQEASAAAATTVPSEGGSSAKPPPKRQGSTDSTRSALGALAEGESSIRPDVLAETYLRLVTTRALKTSDPPRLSDSDVSAGHLDIASSASTMSSLAGLDVFGWDADPSTALLPLVDAWLEVDQYLSEDEIPSPLELREEVEKIKSIIKQGLVRLASTQKTESEIKREHPVVSTDSDLTVETDDTDYWPSGHPSSMTQQDAFFKSFWGLKAPLASAPSVSTASVRTPLPGSPELRPHAMPRVVSSDFGDVHDPRTISSSIHATLLEPAQIAQSPKKRTVDTLVQNSDVPPSAYRGSSPPGELRAHQRAARALRSFPRIASSTASMVYRRVHSRATSVLQHFS